MLIKYIKSVLWRVAKRLSYIEKARCLNVNVPYSLTGGAASCHEESKFCVVGKSEFCVVGKSEFCVAGKSEFCVVGKSEFCFVGKMRRAMVPTASRWSIIGRVGCDSRLSHVQPVMNKLRHCNSFLSKYLEFFLVSIIPIMLHTPYSSATDTVH